MLRLPDEIKNVTKCHFLFHLVTWANEPGLNEVFIAIGEIHTIERRSNEWRSWLGTSNIDEEDRIERGTDTFANLVSFPKPDLISVRLWEKVWDWIYPFVFGHREDGCCCGHLRRPRRPRPTDPHEETESNWSWLLYVHVWKTPEERL